MELGLIGVSDRSGHREREGQILAELPMKSQLFQRLQLLLYFPPIMKGIDIGRFFFKAAVYVPAKLPVFLKGRLVGIKILFGPVKVKLTDELVINEPVLGCDFGGRIFGDAAADGLCLRQHIGDPGLVQQVSAQDSRHTAPDDQHVRFNVLIQRFKAWKIDVLLP